MAESARRISRVVSSKNKAVYIARIRELTESAIRKGHDHFFNEEILRLLDSKSCGYINLLDTDNGHGGLFTGLCQSVMIPGSFDKVWLGLDKHERRVLVIPGFLDNNIVIWETEPVAKSKCTKVICRSGEIFREFVVTGTLTDVNIYRRYVELPRKLSRFYQKVNKIYMENRKKHGIPCHCAM